MLTFLHFLFLGEMLKSLWKKFLRIAQTLHNVWSTLGIVSFTYFWWTHLSLFCILALLKLVLLWRRIFMLSVTVYNFLYSHFTLGVVIELSVLLLALMLCHIGVQQIFNAIKSINARFNAVEKNLTNTAVNFKWKHLQPLTIQTKRRLYYEVKLIHEKFVLPSQGVRLQKDTAVNCI